jgi:hypothetical protein
LYIIFSFLVFISISLRLLRDLTFCCKELSINPYKFRTSDLSCWIWSSLCRILAFSYKISSSLDLSLQFSKNKFWFLLCNSIICNSCFSSRFHWSLFCGSTCWIVYWSNIWDSFCYY